MKNTEQMRRGRELGFRIDANVSNSVFPADAVSILEALVSKT